MKTQLQQWEVSNGVVHGVLWHEFGVSKVSFYKIRQLGGTIRSVDATANRNDGKERKKVWFLFDMWCSVPIFFCKIRKIKNY